MQQEQQPIESAPIKPLYMLILGVVIGLIGGYGVVLFRFAISFFHNLLFYGTLSLHYDANVHADPSTWDLCLSLQSALSMGSGASVGREGPIIQIGSAFGSAVGQWIAMPTRQRITLIAAI